MKRIFIFIFFISTTVFAQKVMRFKVEGMDCPFCASKIEKELKRISGVESIGIDMEKESLKVKTKDASTTTDEIIKAIENAGFSGQSL